MSDIAKPAVSGIIIESKDYFPEFKYYFEKPAKPPEGWVHIATMIPGENFPSPLLRYSEGAYILESDFEQLQKIRASLDADFIPFVVNKMAKLRRSIGSYRHRDQKHMIAIDVIRDETDKIVLKALSEIDVHIKYKHLYLAIVRYYVGINIEDESGD